MIHKAWVVVILVILFLTCLHRWYVLGLLREDVDDSLPVRGFDKMWYFAKKSISVFFYFFSYFTNGQVDTEMEKDEFKHDNNVYIEKIIVVALGTFVFFTLLLYGGSTAAGFVRSINPHGPE